MGSAMQADRAAPATAQIGSRRGLFGPAGKLILPGSIPPLMPAWLMVSFLLAFAPGGRAQTAAAPASGAGGDAFQGSVTAQPATSRVRPLSLDEAVRMGLKYNLGLVLANEGVNAVRGQRLQQLQALLPAVDAGARTAVQQTDLQAEGLRIPGFPAVIARENTCRRNGDAELIWIRRVRKDGVQAQAASPRLPPRSGACP